MQSYCVLTVATHSHFRVLGLSTRRSARQAGSEILKKTSSSFVIAQLSKSTYHRLGKMAPAHISIPRNDLVDGYRGVRRKAKNLLCNLRQLQLEQRKLSLPRSGVSSRVQAVIDGRNVSDISTTGLPSKTQALVRVILSYSEKTVDLVVAHLEDHLYWMQGMYFRRVNPLTLSANRFHFCP